jgi:hypothetical protein
MSGDLVLAFLTRMAKARTDSQKPRRWLVSASVRDKKDAIQPHVRAVTGKRALVCRLNKV